MKKFQTVNISNQLAAPKKPDTTELVKEALLLAIDSLKDKVQNSDNAKDISIYTGNIQTLVNAYKSIDRSWAGEK